MTETENGLKEPKLLPYRLNMTFDPKEKEDLENLVSTTRKTSMIDVVRAAMVLYKAVVEHQKTGGKVILRTHDGKDETLFLL